MLKIRKNRYKVTIRFDNRYNKINWTTHVSLIAEVTPEELIETTIVQHKYEGFPNLFLDLYTSGKKDKQIFKEIAVFIKYEFPNNKINWELVDRWLNR